MYAQNPPKSNHLSADFKKSRFGTARRNEDFKFCAASRTPAHKCGTPIVNINPRVDFTAFKSRADKFAFSSLGLATFFVN
jgi:hypothetical protein